MCRLLLLTVVLALTGCSATRPTPSASAALRAVDSTVAVTILHVNDVYEITPVENGRVGGLARLATVRRRLLAETPHVITVLPGDFYSPSALGTARVDGRALAGRQMVAVLNVLGLDVAAFGNHEFDLNEADFRARLAESRFAYVASNVTGADWQLFPGTARHRILTFASPYGPMRVGLVGATIASNPKPYVRYEDPIEGLRREAAAVRDSAHAIVALTHLAFAQDAEAAAKVPALDLILGGHEHDNIHAYRGADFTPILKADANARTAYVHRLRLHPRRGLVGLTSELLPIKDTIPEDPAVAAEVQRWVEVGYAGFRAAGFDPTARVTTLPEAFDGREASVRNSTTNLTALLAEAFYREAAARGGADLAVFNSGSIRIDDELPAGPATEYDVIRVLPFGGEVVTAEVRGATLDSVLTQGVANRGTGGWLQHHGLTNEGGAWRIGGAPLDPRRLYRVATTDFLVSGREAGLAFFSRRNPNVRVIATHRDVRRAVIEEMQRRYGR
jgi:5'-nucleotidase / UDP-sugar diphosphatase